MFTNNLKNVTHINASWIYLHSGCYQWYSLVRYSQISYIRQNLMVNIILTTWSQWQGLTIHYWIFLLAGNVYGWIEGKCGFTLLFQSKKEHHLPPNLPEIWTWENYPKNNSIYFYILPGWKKWPFLGEDSLSLSHLLGEFPRHLVEYSHWYGNSVGKHTWKRTRPITWCGSGISWALTVKPTEIGSYLVVELNQPIWNTH